MSRNKMEPDTTLNKSLKKALYRYNRKIEKGRFSLPAEAGRMVIIVSSQADHNSTTPAEDQIDAFNNEADWLKSLYEKTYDTVEIKRKAYSLDIPTDLSSKEVAGITLIGHGNIGDFWLEGGKHLNWTDVARLKYLKMGEFVHRACGNFKNEYSIPLGTFAVYNQNNYIAPVGKFIDDVYPDESLFRPVYSEPLSSTEQIHSLIDQHLQKQHKETR